MKNESKVQPIQPVSAQVIFGDSRSVLPPLGQVADLIVTSPPYADARKKHYSSIHPDKFADWFVSFHQAFYDVLKPEGSLVINIKDKAVDGVKHRYVWQTIEKLSNLGWYSIDDYIWHKTNPMPGYWGTRLRDGWEYCFHLSKTKTPFMNQEAVKVPTGEWAEKRLAKLTGKSLTRHNSENLSGFGRDLRRWVGKDTVLPSNVLSMALVGKNFGHPAVFPINLPAFFINLLTPVNGCVVDPFGGSGTTAIAALSLNRNVITVDNDVKYCALALQRIVNQTRVSKDRVTPVNFSSDIEETPDNKTHRLLEKKVSYKPKRANS